ncbi:hypothetical protein QYE76_058545 [Lolium multiflorum]|uniref:F-box domain-containing protein n=1 Tax=Lolium multiflorum TaxID=4521 RepID=A0AAD8T723_LOLMU|nr:hypothetical protein QYE76_058545 [Lolium multiflorum]
MATQLLAPAPAPPSTTTTDATITAAAAATTTTCTSSTSTATTIFSLTDDDLREIFLRLPDLRALIRAALTCRPWLQAIRSSRPFRRLFRALHPAPLLGLFLEIGNASAPSFLPLRRSDPVVAAGLRRGDFFLTSLPPLSTGWGFADCRDGYVLLWNMMPKRPSLVALNPVTWAIDVLPRLPGQIATGSRRDFAVLGFHLLCSDERPWSFRVSCVCADQRRVRVAVFSSETWEWAVRPWVHVGGNCSLKYRAGTLVGGSIFWPYQGEARMIRIDTATMDISFLDLPPEVEVAGFNFAVGDTKNGELCIVYESAFFLLTWIRRSVDGTEVWAPPTVLSLGEELDRHTLASVLDVQLDLKIVQVRSGLVHLSSTCMTHAGTLHCWFFSLPLETMELELLLEGSFEGDVHLYNMAWPPSLVGDDESIGHG